MTSLYPLKFEPILKERVWGGNALSTQYNKTGSTDKKIGESWEISCVQGDISIIANGFLQGNNLEEVLEVYMGDIVGDEIYEIFGNEFPLLIKLIDARMDLSIQVHPDDSLALERHQAYGKTEMWYILESGKDSRIFTGFHSKTDKKTYLSSLDNNSLDSLLRIENPRPGDAFYIPSGRVHAIGSDVLLAEIQQSSDITYRICDWGRLGLDGKPRELHTELAVDAIDYNEARDHLIRINSEANSVNKLVDCKYFTTNIINIDSRIERDYFGIDSFIVYLCTDGDVELSWENESLKMEKGETVLIPATIERTILSSDNASILEVFIEIENLKSD